MSKSHAGMGGSTAAARRAPGWYDDVAPQSSLEEGAPSDCTHPLPVKSNFVVQAQVQVKCVVNASCSAIVLRRTLQACPASIYVCVSPSLLWVEVIS